MKPIRILLADDHIVIRKGLRLLLESQPGFQVIAEASDGRETVAHGRSASARRGGAGCRHADAERHRGRAADLGEAAADRHRVSEHAFRRGLRAEGAEVRRARRTC